MLQNQPSDMQVISIPAPHKPPMRNPPPFQLDGVDIDRALAMRYPAKAEREFFLYWMLYGVCPPTFPNGLRRDRGFTEEEPRLSQWEDDLDDPRTIPQMMLYDATVLGEYWRIDHGQSQRAGRRELYRAATGRDETCRIHTRWFGCNEAAGEPFVVKCLSPARRHQRHSSFHSSLPPSLPPSLDMGGAQASQQTALQQKGPNSPSLESISEHSVARDVNPRSLNDMLYPTSIPAPRPLRHSHRRNFSAADLPSPTSRLGSTSTNLGLTKGKRSTDAASLSTGSSPSLSVPVASPHSVPLQSQSQSIGPLSPRASGVAQDINAQSRRRNASRSTPDTRKISSSPPPRRNQPLSSTKPRSRVNLWQTPLKSNNTDGSLKNPQNQPRLGQGPPFPSNPTLPQPDLEDSSTMLFIDRLELILQFCANRRARVDAGSPRAVSPSSPAHQPDHLPTTSDSFGPCCLCSKPRTQQLMPETPLLTQLANTFKSEEPQELLFGIPISKRDWDEFCGR